MPVTQVDIAKKLKVSRSLVAGVLTNNPLIRTTPANRERVLAAARDMGYAPSSAARMLRNGKTKTIAATYIKTPEQVGYYFATSMGILAEELGHLGYKLEIKVHHDNDALEAWLSEMVQSRSCDAVVLWGFDQDVEHQGKVLESLGHPFVARGHHELRHPHWFQTDSDFHGMMRLSVDKLADMGHQRIGFLGHENGMVYAAKYHDGYTAAMTSRFGCAAPSSWQFLSHENEASTLDIIRRFNELQLLPEDQRPTALVCGPGGSVMHQIELILLGHGTTIGDAPGQFGLSGLLNRPLVIGHGWFFSPGFDVLLKPMVTKQLSQLLQGTEPESRMLRVLPSLEPTVVRDFERRSIAEITKRLACR